MCTGILGPNGYVLRCSQLHFLDCLFFVPGCIGSQANNALPWQAVGNRRDRMRSNPIAFPPKGITFIWTGAGVYVLVAILVAILLFRYPVRSANGNV